MAAMLADRPREIRLHQDARGKVTARLVGTNCKGADYDDASALGRLMRDHPDRFGVVIAPATREGPLWEE